MAKKPLNFKHFTDADYVHKKDKDPERSYEADKRKEEALDPAQRMRAARRMKSTAMQAKIQRGQKQAARRMANADRLNKRSRKAARNAIVKKMTKDIPKGELSFARRKDIENRLDKKKALVNRLAKKMLPSVRKRELERKRSNSGSK